MDSYRAFMKKVNFLRDSLCVTIICTLVFGCIAAHNNTLYLTNLFASTIIASAQLNSQGKTENSYSADLLADTSVSFLVKFQRQNFDHHFTDYTVFRIFSMVTFREKEVNL